MLKSASLVGLSAGTRIMGIDPGFGRTGIGIIDLDHGETRHVWHHVIDTSKDTEFTERLQILRHELQDAINIYKPQAAAIESLFFQTNAKTAMKVGMARGVILITVADAGLPSVELTPSQVKQGITGYGSADKEQVKSMIMRVLKLESAPKLDDATDALAIAIVGGYMFLNQKRALTKI